MALLLLDLDNTLVDRAFAYQRWARRYAASLGGNEEDVSWLIAEDAIPGIQSTELPGRDTHGCLQFTIIAHRRW